MTLEGGTGSKAFCQIQILRLCGEDSYEVL